LFGLAIGRWGKNNMGEMNCEKKRVLNSHDSTMRPQQFFFNYETNLMLLNSTKTWFATSFLMVERLFRLKPTIEQTVVNLDLTTFVNSLCGSHH